MIKNVLQPAKQQQQQQQKQQQQQQQQITADAAEKNHFYYSPIKGKKDSPLSNPRKEEYQNYYCQKSKRKCRKRPKYIRTST